MKYAFTGNMRAGCTPRDKVIILIESH